MLASTMHAILESVPHAPGFLASVGLLALYVFT